MDDQLLNNKNFLVELCRYYMEFLETDFKGKRPPSRKVLIRNSQDAITDVMLSKYSRLNNIALRLIERNFDPNPFSTVGKNDFIIKLPENLITQILNKQEPERLISDFLKSLQITDRDTIIKDILDPNKKRNIRDTHTYLSEFVVLNFFDEVYDLWKNKQVLDKQDFYLYFLDIHFDDVVYPIFYIPISVDRTVEGKFTFEFDPVILINKKAIQYISEHLNENKKLLKPVELPPRHQYLSNFEDKGSLLSFLQGVVNEICQCFGVPYFQMNDPEVIEVKSDQIKISNNCYLSLFDKSDEAILNDYEELLNMALSSNGSQVLEILSKLSSDYLFENPQTFEREVEQEYDDQHVTDKLSYTSPIPLNKEQLQVLHSLVRPACQRVIIEGPPGTGKSHTITAIIYDALLSKKSVLMVSDKKEALDVVEEKISDVLDKMRLDDFIQNPILRLGKKDTNYNNIFKQINFDKIKTRFNTYKRHKDQVEKEIDAVLGTIKKNISDEIDISLSLTPTALNHLIAFEEAFNTIWKPRIDLMELEELNSFPDDLVALWTATQNLRKCHFKLAELFKLNYSDILDTVQLKPALADLSKDIKALHNRIAREYHSLLLSKEISKDKVNVLENTLSELVQLRKPVIGFLLSGKRIAELQQQFNEHFFLSNISSIKTQRDRLAQELQLYKYCLKLNETHKKLNFDSLYLLRENKYPVLPEAIKEFIDSVEELGKCLRAIPRTAEAMGIYERNLAFILKSVLAEIEQDDITELAQYLKTYQTVVSGTSSLATSNYLSDRQVLENRLIFKMTNILDESVVRFREEFKNDAEEIRKLIRAKKKIPKQYLQELVEAFPCLIVGVRELGEFIPLEPNIFDVVIIDEASQVSIAQAFPAILRGKKVVVLGDPKQYSNVKSHNAAIAVNNFLFNKVKEAFKESISTLSLDIQDRVRDKINSFNIKNSILDFLRNVSNYQCSLKKHFRGYQEIIGYSNDTFYRSSLQVMKIRGKRISEVIQFHLVNIDNIPERFRNTNQAEADFVIEELERLKEEGFKGSVGIITPFTNQQKLISNKVYDSVNWQFYLDEFKLRIMTFDSCQGDEKDIIYYSMVEKPGEEILKYIFPIRLSHLDEEEDGNLKAQRLNVGFSRARESVRFVLSKPPEQIKGEAGKALQYYYKHLQTQDTFELAKLTDPHSPMEKELLSLITQTNFFKENMHSIEIVPQFDIGKYIKQLNPLAQIPNYRNDFLLIYQAESGKSRMVILEYDGFEYHFKDNHLVDETNFDKFYIEEDIERRKTIESYGYPFIRLNKFILRDDPITFLNEKLEECCKKKL
jgi:hypothetical protein